MIATVALLMLGSMGATVAQDPRSGAREGPDYPDEIRPFAEQISLLMVDSRAATCGESAREREVRRLEERVGAAERRVSERIPGFSPSIWLLESSPSGPPCERYQFYIRDAQRLLDRVDHWLAATPVETRQ